VERQCLLPDSKKFEVFVRFTNFTNEKYFLGSSFADTMLMTKAPPMETSLGVKVKVLTGCAR
jgi:hypothetical protein